MTGSGFFNLTQVGFQNTIKERCQDVKEDPEATQTNLKYKNGLPEVTITPSPEKINPTHAVHGNSFKELKRLHIKHKRTPFGKLVFESLGKTACASN